MPTGKKGTNEGQSSKSANKYQVLFQHTQGTVTPPAGAFGALALQKAKAAASTSEANVGQHQIIAVENLLDNPWQPRKNMDEEKLQELMTSIREHGFRGVLEARPHPDLPDKYQLIFGHRRREAAIRVGLTTLPVIVKDANDDAMLILGLVENIQRDDLTVLEEADTFFFLHKEARLTYNDIAQAVGKSVGYVRNRLRVADAPEPIRAMVRKKPDSLRAVIYLLKITDPTLLEETIALILAGTLTADDIDQYIKDQEQNHTQLVEKLAEVPDNQAPSFAQNSPTEGYSFLPQPSTVGETVISQFSASPSPESMETSEPAVGTGPVSQPSLSAQFETAVTEEAGDREEPTPQPSTSVQFVMGAIQEPAETEEDGDVVMVERRVRLVRLKTLRNTLKKLIPRGGALSSEEQEILQEIREIVQSAGGQTSA